MSVPTIAVTCAASDQGGESVAGGIYTAKLDQTEIYDGFVVPELVTAVAGDAGLAILNLWPNALGVNGSTYRVTGRNPDTGKKFFDAQVVVPNNPCNLYQIIQNAPFPSVDAAQQALTEVQALVAVSNQDAREADDDRIAAETAAAWALTRSSAAALSQYKAALSESAINQAIRDGVPGGVIVPGNTYTGAGVVSVTPGPNGQVISVVEDAAHRFTSDTEKIAWNAKQPKLVSGDNLSTINGQSLLSGVNINITGGGNGVLVTEAEKAAWNAKQAALVSGANISTLNGQSLLNGGNIVVTGGAGPTVTDTEKTYWNAKQAALVSGTNVKTINGQPLLGAGNINIEGTLGAAAETEYRAIGVGAVLTPIAATLQQFVYPENFGAIGDNLSHPLSTRYATLADAQVPYPFATSLTQEIDYCAIQAAIVSQTFGSGWGLMGPTVYLKAGSRYYCGTNSIQLKRYIKIVGPGNGMQSTCQPSTIRFAPNTRGIEINTWNTIGNDYEATPTSAADGSILEGFMLIGGGGDPLATIPAHGIHMRARASLCRLTVNGFAGNGVNVTAASDQFGAGAGNANCFHISTLTLTNNGRNGLYIVGYDGNAGYVELVDATENAWFGIKDDSFLGCTFVGCHAASNGQKDGKSAYAKYGTAWYTAHQAASLDQLRTVQPGTNNNVWYPCQETERPVTWTGNEALGVFRHGGSYSSKNSNARSLFVGCYSEGGQGVVFLSQHSQAIGGFFSETPIITGAATEGRFGATWSAGAFESQTRIDRGDLITARLGGADANGRSMSLAWSAYPLGPHAGKGAIAAWTYSANGTLSMPGLCSVSPPGSPRPGLTEYAAMLLGEGGTSRLFGRVNYSTGGGVIFPTTGNYIAGDILIAPAAQAGDFIGLVCTVTGEAGSTAVFKKFGAIQS